MQPLFCDRETKIGLVKRLGLGCTDLIGRGISVWDETGEVENKNLDYPFTICTSRCLLSPVPTTQDTNFHQQETYR